MEDIRHVIQEQHMQENEQKHLVTMLWLKSIQRDKH
jgi:hypothetical protein